jgi:hypothetical protein
MKIKKAYIAGRYTADTPEEVEENVKRAEAVAWLYYLKGYAVFCPHAQTHRIHLRYNGDGIFEYEDWLQADIAWLKDCDVIVFIAGWEESKGARMEHVMAKALGKEIHYLAEEEIQAVMKDAKR